ncbi:hypothetical protein HFN49_31790 [Rhizobium leguminosarum]|nr:hypothetical protein [Rhizobium ruizarguesonis]MBY5890759.1 hypothetical protein [Rhizobium leguminosarum]QSZ05123.1 hypothetical protein J3P73_31430 [Rhizobium ruizarguesonis]
MSTGMPPSSLDDQVVAAGAQRFLDVAFIEVRTGFDKFVFAVLAKNL